VQREEAGEGGREVTFGLAEVAFALQAAAGIGLMVIGVVGIVITIRGDR
jgi:hypothetical protein